MSAETRVQRGIEYLDQKAAEGDLLPDWRQEINCAVLDIGSFDSCVLGQLAPSKDVFDEKELENPYMALYAWFDLRDDRAFELGFDGFSPDDYEELTDAWKVQLPCS